MPNFHALKEGRTIVEVSVKDNNVEGALRILKKKMQREGIFKEMKMRSFFEKPSQKLPKVVLANLALDLDVAVYHQALLVLKANFKLLSNIFTIVIMCMIIIQSSIKRSIVYNRSMTKYNTSITKLF